ncbi:MAG TPA: rhodanese-like domain-containing protein [Flavitalea sp.]|nr:rhodanese-like domain-containing protein [Flavitalea sp.]
MNQITPAALQEKMDSHQSFQLIDVREPAEHDSYSIGGELIPLGEIMDRKDLIPIDKPVIFYCKIGIRSQIAIQRLQEKYGFTNLYNLQGGIERWKKEIHQG